MIFGAAGLVTGEDLGPWDEDIRASLPAASDRDAGRAVRQQEAIRFAREEGMVRSAYLMRMFGVSRETARQDLVDLVAAGRLVRTGSRKGAAYVPCRP